MIPLIGCDMFMLQSIEGYPFFTLPSDNGDFNDPYDYFEDFKRLSDGSSGNRDGYGIIAYSLSSDLVSRDYTWYKTGIGNHFDANNPDEPLYQAISLLYNNPTIERVLVHARSGTGGTGSHPFLFNYDDRTYSFMHNGYVFNNVKREIMNFLGQEWFDQHPSQWQGVYGDIYSFIDSELIFHYLMYYIKQSPNDIPTALRKAFNNKEVGNIDMEFILKYNNSSIVNFVLSDGIDSYVYRSSRILGTSYNLSYQIYPDNFLAVKTGSNLENQITKNQMLKMTTLGQVDSLNLSPVLQTTFLSQYVEVLEDNQLELNWKIMSNPNIRQFNIYFSEFRNFTTALKIATISPNNADQTDFSYINSSPTIQEHYYWIEIVYSDNSSEITSSIPSSQQDDPYDPPQHSEAISLYPNPFQEELNISIDSQNEYKIRIYNLKGQLIDKLIYKANKSQPLIWKTDSINDKNLANGIYILEFSSGSIINTRKIMRIN